MNPIIKTIIGEADMHSPTERAVLDQETQSGIESHGEGDLGNSEESKEVQLANQILAAVKSGDKQGVITAASELIRMHDQPTADSYAREHAKLPPSGGSHVQPVPHPQPPRAGSYGMHRGGM